MIMKSWWRGNVIIIIIHIDPYYYYYLQDKEDGELVDGDEEMKWTRTVQ